MTRIFVDVTRTAREDTHTGIQKVVRSLFRSLSQIAGPGSEVVPIVIENGAAFRLPGLSEHPYERYDPGAARLRAAASAARRWAKRRWERIHLYAAQNHMRPDIRIFLGVMRRAMLAPRAARRAVARLRRGPPVAFAAGDVLLLPDSAWSTDPWPVVDLVKVAGGRVVTIWYDIIPITNPELFPPTLTAAFERYLDRTIAKADRIVCISKTVRREVEAQALRRGFTPRVADLYPIVTVAPPPAEPRPDLAAAFDRRTVLIVATIEPRKGHALLLDACEMLWAEGRDFNLVVIGRVGWQVEGLIGRLARHPERGARLFLFHDATDADVGYALRRAALKAFPSKAEGLGLPILEAELAGCPALCSDIPVFREIASPATNFFSPYGSAALADALRRLLSGDALEACRALLRQVPRTNSSDRYGAELLRIIEDVAAESRALAATDAPSVDH